ncbi:MAG: AAA family ATPase [Bacteroidota bacterium]
MHDRKDTILAIVGLAGTGKSVLTHYLTEKYELTRIYFGGYVLKEVKRRGLEINPQNEKYVREDLRKLHQMEAIALLALPDIQAAIAAGEKVIIDGIYSFSEYVLLKKELGERLKLVAVHCPRELRYARLSTRKPRSLTPTEVDQRDFFEIRNLEKGGPIAIADYHILNDQGLPQLYDKMEEIVRIAAGRAVAE